MPMEMVTRLPYDHPYRWDGTLFGGPKLWRPTELATALWLDAEDTSTITLNGATVSQWADKSGNGRNVTQATATAQPTYVVNSFNSRTSLSFDGTSDFLTVPAITHPNNQASFYSVFNVSDTSYSVYTDTSRTGWERFTDGLTYSAAFRSVRISNLALGFPSSGSAIVGYIANSNTPSYRITLNGSVAYTNLGAFTFSSNLIELGRAPGTDFFAGNLGEIIMTSSELSTADRQRVEGYLAWKWGLEANLPAGHPYKSLPPTI